MKFLSPLLGIAFFLSLCAAIVLFVIYPVPMVVNGAWILSALLLMVWIGLNHKTVWIFLTKRSTRYGANLAFVLFLILGILVFVNILAFSMVFPLLPLYAKEFQASEGLIGVMASLFALAQLLFSPFYTEVRPCQNLLAYQ